MIGTPSPSLPPPWPPVLTGTYLVRVARLLRVSAIRGKKVAPSAANMGKNSTNDLSRYPSTSSPAAGSATTHRSKVRVSPSRVIVKSSRTSGTCSPSINTPSNPSITPSLMTRICHISFAVKCCPLLVL